MIPSRVEDHRDLNAFKQLYQEVLGKAENITIYPCSIEEDWFNEQRGWIDSYVKEHEETVLVRLDRFGLDMALENLETLEKFVNRRYEPYQH